MTKFKQLSIVNIVLITFIFYIFITTTASALPQKTVPTTDIKIKNILILHSYHRGLMWCNNIEDGILSELHKIKNYELDIKTEYMDVKEYEENIYYEKLVDLYFYKYKNKKFDLIICTDNAAFNFLVHFRKKLFEDVPIVFSGVNNFNTYNVEDIYNMTGILEEEDIEGNLNLISSLHPNIKNITAVVDKSPVGNYMYNKLVEIKKNTNYNFKIHIIQEKSISDLIKTISELPASNALFFMASYLKNTDGSKIYLPQAIKYITPHVRIPIYGIWDTHISGGVVGGKITSSFKLGSSAGQAAKEILEGKSVNDISIKKNEGIEYVFDYAELKKFSINSNKLPENSTIFNTPPTVYSIAKKELQNIALAIIILFLIIIVILAINILKRKRLAKELGKSKNHLEENLKFLRTLLDTIPNPIYCKNIDGKYTECNKHFEKMFGLKREDILNKKFSEIYEGDYIKMFDLADLMLIKNGGTQMYESKIKSADNSKRDVLINKAIIYNSDNDINGIVGVIVDMTERRKREYKLNRMSKLRESIIELNQSILGLNNEELFSLILETAIDSIDGAKFGSILLLDKNNNLTMTTSKGYDEDKAKDFFIPLTDSFQWIKTKGNIKNTVIINNIHDSPEFRDIYRKGIKENWYINSCISAPIIIDNKLYGMLNIDSNKLNAFSEEDLEIMEYLRAQIEISITKHKLYEEIIYFSKYDNLTNIYNRKAFKDIFNKRFYGTTNFSLVMFDLNKLKFVNDTYGHVIGDYYIKTFVKALKAIINKNDIIARYGGDEFICISYDLEHILIAKFEALLEYFIQNPLKLEKNDVICSFSYGIAKCPEDSNSYDELIKIADQRMYLYKRNTR